MTKALSQDEKNKRAVLDALRKLSRPLVGDDALLFEGTRFILPEKMKGNTTAAIKYLQDWEQQQSARFEFSRTFNYRPMDGAHAFQATMLKLFGTAGIGQRTDLGMFGSIPPEYKTINVGPGETKHVPWGRVGYSPLEATFTVGAVRSNDFGVVSIIHVEAPRRYRAEVEAFFAVMEIELQTNSIYRGKAITACGSGGEPTFLDPSSVDPTKVVYSEEVLRQLDTNLWSLIRYTDEMRRQGVALKRAVLVEGPYGTGKTLAGMLTAREAVAHGWTFILARPGDKLADVLSTAQIYAPCVVWHEDIDVAAGTAVTSDTALSAMLDALDGITAKGVAVIAGFTTNHVDKIQMGALRPGRIDVVVHVGELDAVGIEKLVKVTIPAGILDADVDFAAVSAAMQGFLPAFAKEAIVRAMNYSISRNKGRLGGIKTADLVDAAHALRPQLELMRQAQEGVTRTPLDEQIRRLVSEGVDGVKVLDNGSPGYVPFTLANASD